MVKKSVDCSDAILKLLEDIDFLDDIPEHLVDLTNIYRTENYIVCQVLSMRCGDNDNLMMSFDTYYLRTDKRDEQYEMLFADRRRINGKRLPASMYTRKYID